MVVGRFCHDLSIDASLHTCAPPAINEIRFEIRPRVCVILHGKGRTVPGSTEGTPHNQEGRSVALSQRARVSRVGAGRITQHALYYRCCSRKTSNNRVIYTNSDTL